MALSPSIAVDSQSHCQIFYSAECAATPQIRSGVFAGLRPSSSTDLLGWAQASCQRRGWERRGESRARCFNVWMERAEVIRNAVASCVQSQPDRLLVPASAPTTFGRTAVKRMLPGPAAASQGPEQAVITRHAQIVEPRTATCSSSVRPLQLIPPGWRWVASALPQVDAAPRRASNHGQSDQRHRGLCLSSDLRCPRPSMLRRDPPPPSRPGKAVTREGHPPAPRPRRHRRGGARRGRTSRVDRRSIGHPCRSWRRPTCLNGRQEGEAVVEAA